MHGHNPIIQYRHQNEKVCTFVCVANDKDVEIMFRASGGDASALCLYIQTISDNEADHRGNVQRKSMIGVVIFDTKPKY